MATTFPPSDQSQPDSPVKEVELLNVSVSREGSNVTAQWALHPQLKKDLLPQELQEVSELMSQVSGVVSTRFAEILSNMEPDKPGIA